MENKMTTLIEFLDNNKIYYKPIHYFINDITKGKSQIGEMNNLPKEEVINGKKTFGSKPKYYKKAGEKVLLSTAEFESMKQAYSVYLKHTDNLFCIDIDIPSIQTLDDLMKNKEFQIFKGCSWVKGNTKGIHLYVKVENVPEYTSELNVFKTIKGDFIKRKNNMWERIDKSVIGELKVFQFNEIEHLFLEEVFNPEVKATKEPKEKKLKKVNLLTEEEKKEVKNELKEFEMVELKESDNKLLDLLDRKKRFESTKDWLKMCWIFKSVGFTFKTFDKLCEGLNGYNEKTNKYYWDIQKTSKINVGIIHHLARIDNPEKYAELNAIEFFEPDKEFEFTRISQRYLLPQGIKKIEDKTDILQGNIIKFFEDDELKSFNLKSPYDTGKTQMIKRIIDTFDPKKILWLSYRKTLTNDILGNFETQYNFKDYQNKEFGSDRLIIQLESILKIQNEMIWTEEDLMMYPEYDLVLIDEVESILSHFNSPTFKGKSKECFQFIQNIMINSKKIITLDGDIGNRTYKFIESFGKYINVVNDIKINPRKFIIDEDYSNFKSKIHDDLEKNKKIVVVSMSSNKCDRLKIETEMLFGEDKKILVYTGSSGDETKADFKNVVESWSKCDLLIYSPTCEAGVNFDMEYFDKMYGMFSDLSTTPRAYFQMLARVRKLKCDEIRICDDCFNTYDVNYKRAFFTFEEVKQSMMLLEGVKLETSDVMKNGKMYKTTKLTPYDTNYIYNRTEQLNASKFYWLSYFVKLVMVKGHTIEYLRNKRDKNNENGEKGEVNNLLLIENIEDDEYDILLEKQKKDKATKEDKLKVKKHHLKKVLGLDDLSVEIIENNLDQNSVGNFTSLIDIENIRKIDDNQTLEKIDKSTKVKQLLSEIGFSSVFDKKVIKKETFLQIVDNIIKNNDMFKDMENTQIRFNLNKTNTCKTTKQFLGFVNTIFEKYSIKVSYTQKTENKVKQTYYKLEQLFFINELLEYRILKGYNLKDPNNHRVKPNTEHYKNLVNWEKVEKIQERKRIKEEWIKQQEENKNKYLFSDIDFGIKP